MYALCSIPFCRAGYAGLKLVPWCLQLRIGPYEVLIDCGIAWDSGLHSGLGRDVRELTDMMTCNQACNVNFPSADLSVIGVEHLI
jgi:hypothetical protein